MKFMISGSRENFMKQRKNIMRYIIYMEKYRNRGWMSENIMSILQQPENFIDSKEFVSWERFFWEDSPQLRRGVLCNCHMVVGQHPLL